MQNIKDVKGEKLKYNFLKNDAQEDKDFLEEITLLNAVSEQVRAFIDNVITL